MDFVDPPSQITIMGSKWLEKRKELDQYFLPKLCWPEEIKREPSRY